MAINQYKNLQTLRSAFWAEEWWLTCGGWTHLPQPRSLTEAVASSVDQALAAFLRRASSAKAWPLLTGGGGGGGGGGAGATFLLPWALPRTAPGSGAARGAGRARAPFAGGSLL